MDKIENIITSFDLVTGSMSFLRDFVDEIIKRNKVLEEQTNTLSKDYIKYRTAYDNITKCVNDKGTLKKITKIIKNFKIDDKK